MRILYLCADTGIPVLGHKGAAVHVREMVAAFTRAGHRTLLAAPKTARSPWDERARLEGTLLHLPPGPEIESAVRALREHEEALGLESSLPGEALRVLYDRELRVRLAREFARKPPDFVYERASLHATAGVWFAREIGRPIVVELNAPLALEQTTYRKGVLGELASRAERWVLRRADAVVAVSEEVGEHALSLGVEARLIHIILNGVEAGRFAPGAPDPAMLSRFGHGPLLGFVGGLRPWHGVGMLPALLEGVLARQPAARMVIVGDGPLRASLEREFERRGLSRRVVFTGWTPHADVPDTIRSFDVALAPYPRLDHPFYFSPLKLFEYMACGVPVVTTDLGQVSDVVRDGETGVLCPPDDLDSLVAACDRLLSDPSTAARLGKAASREVRDKYTWDVNASRVVGIVRSLAPEGEST